MSVTPASIKTFAPEFVALTDPVVQAAIDQAERRTSRTQWAGKADDGVTYLTCHLLAVAAQVASSGSGGQGALTSQRVGPLARSFANPFEGAPYTQAWFALSKYGLAYVEIRSLVFVDRIGC